MVDRSILLGLGFDCKDGHKRITLAENYKLYGGSKKTHRIMQEKCIKFDEQLKKRRKTLDDIEIEEFYEIAHKVDLNVPSKNRFRP